MVIPKLCLRTTTLCLLVGGASFSYGGLIDQIQCDNGRFTVFARAEGDESCRLETRLFRNDESEDVQAVLFSNRNVEGGRVRIPLAPLLPSDNARVEADLICESAVFGRPINIIGPLDDALTNRTDNGCNAQSDTGRPVAVNVLCQGGAFTVQSQPQGNPNCEARINLTVNGEDQSPNPAPRPDPNQPVTNTVLSLPNNAVAQIQAQLVCDNTSSTGEVIESFPVNRDTVTGCRGSAEEQQEQFTTRRQNEANNPNILSLDCRNSRVLTTVNPPDGSRCDLTRTAVINDTPIADINNRPIRNLGSFFTNPSPLVQGDIVNQYTAEVTCTDGQTSRLELALNSDCSSEQQLVGQPSGTSVTVASDNVASDPQLEQLQPRSELGSGDASVAVNATAFSSGGVGSSSRIERNQVNNSGAANVVSSRSPSTSGNVALVQSVQSEPAPRFDAESFQGSPTQGGGGSSSSASSSFSSSSASGGSRTGQTQASRTTGNGNSLSLDCSGGRVQVNVTPVAGAVCNLRRNVTIGGTLITDINNIDGITAFFTNDSLLNPQDDVNYTATLSCEGDNEVDLNVLSSTGCNG